MYFTEIYKDKPLNESFYFSIKNFINFIKNMFKNIGELEILQSNIDRMKREFYSRYKIDDKVITLLQKLVDEFAVKQESKLSPVDFVELDKYFKLKDRIGSGNKIIDSYDSVAIYGFMYRSMLNDTFAARYGMMTIPYVLNNRYILFIQFDDKDIHNISIVASENMYDLQSNTGLCNLDFQKYLYPRDYTL